MPAQSEFRMKILILNPILYSGNNNFIPKVETIKDTMIYSMCLGFKSLGHQVTLLALECNKPTKEESYDFEILFFKKNFDRFLNAALPLSFSLNNYIRKNAKNSDIFICEGMYGEQGDINNAVKYKHMTFEEAAGLARDAEVRELWLTHYSPAINHPEIFMENVRKIFANAHAAKDRRSAELNFEE